MRLLLLLPALALLLLAYDAGVFVVQDKALRRGEKSFLSSFH